MPKSKKKQLPKDFEALLDQGDLAALKAVFDSCDVDAHGGYSKRTALAFDACPDALARWLVEQGADLAAPDAYGETPLHVRAGHWRGRIDVLLELGADVNATDSRGDTPLHKAAAAGNAETVRLLLQHGARSDARNHAGLTPLAHALQRCSNAQIAGLASVAELLLDAEPRPATGLRGLAARLTGGPAASESGVTPEMQDSVRRIGTDFEFHRAGFNPEFLDETSAALDRLYQLFDVAPVPRRLAYDGRSPIVASPGAWQDQHQDLWELLVPSSGAATTVQGEVVRISGRIHIELEENGGVNWDEDYRKMADALLHHLGSGRSLSAPELAEAGALVRDVRRRQDASRRLCELAVAWVKLNPAPATLPPPAYRR